MQSATNYSYESHWDRRTGKAKAYVIARVASQSVYTTLRSFLRGYILMALARAWLYGHENPVVPRPTK
jgi:hypothetical protein